jgi:phage shock protein C
MDKFYATLRSIPLRRGPKRILGGIAGGIADKTGWDVTLVRIGVLLSFLLPFIGVGLYLVLWLLIPLHDDSIALERLVGDRR